MLKTSTNRMDSKVSNLKHVALGWKILLFLAVKCSLAITGPQKEVVSIYNDKFSTPPSKPQYFIEVYRCVELGFDECQVSSSKNYPVPKTMNKIEIVVPDVTNSNNKKKFYKYLVYNHTTCECGSFADRETKLYGPITKNEVSEADFKKKSLKNPVNLARSCNVCKSPQPRYKLHPEHAFALQLYKYLPYQQCLPVCLAVKTTASKTATYVTHKDVVVYVRPTSDISCKAYDGVKTQQQSKSSVGSSKVQEANDAIVVSGKLILATFIVSLVLFSILVIDVTLRIHNTLLNRNKEDEAERIVETQL